MAQQTQQKPAADAQQPKQQKMPVNNAPQQGAQQPAQPGQQPVQGEKKSRWWIWLIVIIVVIGIGLFLWLF